MQELERNPESAMGLPVTPVEQPEKEEYRLSKQEALREYGISIRFLNRGCIVRVGCKEIAFEDYTNAMATLNAYVNNPWEEQKKWRKILD